MCCACAVLMPITCLTCRAVPCRAVPRIRISCRAVPGPRICLACRARARNFGHGHGTARAREGHVPNVPCRARAWARRVPKSNGSGPARKHVKPGLLPPSPCQPIKPTLSPRTSSWPCPPNTHRSPSSMWNSRPREPRSGSRRGL